MLKFYENEYGFIKMEELRITNEFKYCTLTCTLVRGGNERFFPTLQNGLVPQVRGGFSVHCGFYQDTSTFKKACVMPSRLSAEMHGLLFSSIYSKFGKFSSTSPMRLDVQTWKQMYTEGFPYSGNCSVLCTVDVYLHLYL